MIAMVDNYDSFTYNLVQYLRELASDEVRVVRNDAMSAADLLALDPTAIVLSPGPGAPEGAGICIELIRRAASVPLLGVCLGHQAITVAYGGEVVRADLPRHGKTSEVRHAGAGLFAGLTSPVIATRYHSLIARRDTLPEELRIDAWTEDGTIMAVTHCARAHFGVQFHPESYLTPDGKAMLARFLDLAGVRRLVA